jgi:phenylacetate-CoA ligase
MNPHLERFYARSPAFVQNAMVTAFGLKIRLERFNRRYESWKKSFDQSERFDAEELTGYQNEHLRRTIANAYSRVPYYRNVMRERGLTPSDFKAQEDLPKLPVLTKSVVRRRWRELIAQDIDPRSLKASPTSGTTGSPLTVYWDKTTDVLWNLLIWRHREWAGVKFGEPYATLLGRLIVPPPTNRPPFWRRNALWHQTLFSSFHLHPDHIPAYVEEMRHCRARFLESYPSTAFILALGLERLGQKLPLKAVFTSSEPLLDIQRDLISDRFECEVFDYYGMSEAVMFAGECTAHLGMHHHMEASVVEVIDRHGNPLESGATGRLVGTTLHNDAMPLIRYDTGDMTTRLARRCSCGRAHHLYSSVTTKAEDILVAPDGRLVSPSVLTHPFKPLRGLVKSQIIQEDLSTLRVLLVADVRPDDRTLSQLREGIAHRLGGAVRIIFEVVPEIPVGPNGKFRWVVSKVPISEKGRNLHWSSDDESV